MIVVNPYCCKTSFISSYCHLDPSFIFIRKSACKSIKNSVTVQEVIALLNEFIELDPEAIQNLINNRCKCNEKVANHPTIQVIKYPEDEDYTVGLLGVMNSLFGIREDGMGAICAEIDDTYGKIITFKETPTLKV